MSPAITRFSKYSAVGVSTFAFDLALLFLLVDVFLLEQVVAAGVAFFVAISINYYISRRYVFKHSRRSLQSGYTNFILIASVGIALVTGGMYIMTHLLACNYLSARIIVAGMTGIWNYLMNLYVNFKVAGKH